MAAKYWPGEDPIGKRVGTVGRVHPHVEVKIVDPATGGVVPRGAPGELCTRGYSVMLGYWADDAATAAAIDHMRHELHHEYPERVDADRDRDRVDHGGKEYGGRTAVEQLAHAEIGVDAGGERQDSGGQLEGGFEPADAIGQQHGCRGTCRGGLRRGSGV